MRFSTLFRLATVLLAPLVVSAAPLKRATDPGTMQVLNFAFVLESLETEFYKQGLAKFKSSDFSDAGFTSADGAIQEITTIQVDESTHVTALETIITSFGATPPSGCSFDFSSALTDVSTMVTIARVVEHVGVAAYLGAAHLVQDPIVLTAAATIVTVEARHGTMLNLFESATAISQSFDIALLPNEVLAIAGSFISGCNLGIPANPSLSVTNTGTVTSGTSLTFSSPALNSSTEGFNCQMLTGGMPFSLSLPLSQCVVPQGLNGAVAIWITSDDQPLNGGVVDRQSNAIVAGPLLTFIDIEVDDISVLIRNKGSSGSGSPSSNSSSSNSGSYNPGGASSFVSTTTVSPSDAAAIISSSTLAPSASGNTSAPSVTPSASAASAAPNPVIANGVSMIPKPTSS
ncbi:ferritin-like domain-containing protein [Russula emetica]|nr:ferritin-like domain-containing protein [Russula emetica]